MSSESDLVDFRQAMALLGVSRATLYRWIHDHRVKAFKVGKQWRFTRHDLDALLEESSESSTQTVAAFTQTAQELSMHHDDLSDAASALSDLNPEAAAAAFAELMIQVAARERVSDIHLDPTPEGGLSMKTRVDGHLVSRAALPPACTSYLVEQIGEMSGGLEGLEQTGRSRLRTEVDGRPLDVRVAHLPAVGGTKLALRILDQERLTFDLDLIFPDPIDRAHVDALLALPYGLVLVSGPSGSGKTTSLYALVRQLAENNAVYSVEDPAEYLLSGITQIQVDAARGITYASALRRIYNADPDVISLADLPDAESARLACKLAVTGHLVFAQVHANSTGQAITQLIRQVGDPDLVASALAGVTNQRLLRKACPHCSKPISLSAQERDAEALPETLTEVASAQGCSECVSGYLGRMAIYETLLPDDALLDAMLEGQDSEQLRALAQSRGMRTLRDAAVEQLAQGRTTLEELRRVTPLRNS